MPAFKDPGFRQRQESAARAKSAALVQLRSKPPMDEAVVAAKAASRLAREAAAVEKRLASRLAEEQAAAAKIERTREAAAEAAAKEEIAAHSETSTEAERKVARDARYAARKSRKLAR